jgi:hypothetical protein
MGLVGMLVVNHVLIVRVMELLIVKNVLAMAQENAMLVMEMEQ